MELVCAHARANLRISVSGHFSRGFSSWSISCHCHREAVTPSTHPHPPLPPHPRHLSANLFSAGDLQRLDGHHVRRRGLARGEGASRDLSQLAPGIAHPTSAGQEQSPGAEEVLSTGWGPTSWPQHPLWLRPLVQGGCCLHPTHGFGPPGHGPKSGEMPKTSPLLRSTTFVVSLLVPSATHVIVTRIPAAAWAHSGLPPHPGWGQADSSQLHLRCPKSPLCLHNSNPRGSSFTLL